MNLANALAAFARSRPDHPALEDGDVVISYAELDQRVDAAAHRLASSGVSVGEVVGITLSDRAELLIVTLALFRLGAVVLSIAPGLSEGEQADAIEGLDVRRVIVEGTAKAPFGTAPLLVERLCEGDFADVRPFDMPNLPAAHPAMVRQSSGTTGRPKATLWSHDFVVGHLPEIKARQDLGPDDRFLQVVPMSFAYSRDLCILILQFGGTVVLGGRKAGVGLADMIREKRITYLTLTPAHLRALLTVESDSRPLLPGLRALQSTSSALTAAEKEELQDRITPNLLDGYGTNEVGLIALAGPDQRVAYPESVGPAVVGIELRIVDEAGTTLPPNEVGLICMRNPGMPDRYVNDPDATAWHYREGWFYPGDLGAMNEAGYLFFKGRADDVINNQGVKFYPLEVEQVLREHPAIVESAVLRWPHARYGQVAVGCCVMTDDLSLGAVQDFCLERISAHKLPAALVRVERLPKTASGKIRKGEVAKLLERFLEPRLA